MHVSDTLYEFHKIFEGYRHKAYRDQVGVLTIGIGHANQHTAEFGEGDEWDDDKIREVWDLDIKAAETRVNNMLKDIGLDEIPQAQFDALVDIVFNTGKKPASMLKAVAEAAAEDFEFADGVAVQLLRWVYAGKQVVFGLIRRRLSMYAMIMGLDWEPLAHACTLDDFNDALSEQGINFEIVKDPDAGYSIVEV